MLHPNSQTLAERRQQAIPRGVAIPAKTILFSTGAEAVENAVKIARAATRRNSVVAFNGAFHGRTLYALSLTGKAVPYKQGFGMPGGDVHRLQGEGGFHPAPPEFLRALRQICDMHGILLIVDEIQTGFARTGRMFALEHAGIRADLLVVAKDTASDALVDEGLDLLAHALRI